MMSYTLKNVRFVHGLFWLSMVYYLLMGIICELSQYEGE